MKKCAKCGLTKPKTDFYKNNNYADGYRTECKECQIETSSTWQKENTHQYQEYQKKWKQKNAQYWAAYMRERRRRLKNDRERQVK